MFIPAGTLNWPNAQIFIFILFAAMFVAGMIMYVKTPDLLKSRLEGKEKESEQKDVIGLSRIMYITAFVTAGLNCRFEWTTLPDSAVCFGIIIFLLSYLLFGKVLRENRYLSRTIKIKEDQKVVDSGLYGVVRHPMYMASTSLFLSILLVLGRIIFFVIMSGYIPLIEKRIRNEEKVLEEGLEGYKEYKQKVRYRMIPFIR